MKLLYPFIWELYEKESIPCTTDNGQQGEVVVTVK